MLPNTKKYKVIAKVDAKKFVKYNVNDLMAFTAFLDKEFAGWRWFNVFQYNKDGDGKKLESFTNSKRPTSKYLLIE